MIINSDSIGNVFGNFNKLADTRRNVYSEGIHRNANGQGLEGAQG